MSLHPTGVVLMIDGVVFTIDSRPFFAVALLVLAAFILALRDRL